MSPLIEKCLAGPGLVQVQILGLVGQQCDRLIDIGEPVRIRLDLARQPVEAQR